MNIEGLGAIRGTEDEIAAAIGDTSRLPQDIFQATAQVLRKQTRLNVVVLGPSPSGGDIYNKRCGLRDELIRQGHRAYFLEDRLTPEVLTASGLNLSVAEYLMASEADYIVCFMTSPGAIAEVHEFADRRKLACKMMVCIDSQHQDGYSAHGILRIFEGLHGRIDWFQYPEDIRECHLSTRVMDQIQKVVESKQSELVIGEGI
ncbi:MAG TPA: hypothetical protein VMX94_00295 [Armatimonadota bacterium]|nr:hypothetical protein [Armatimonadota bacterium]